MQSINSNNVDSLYSKLLKRYGIYFLFKEIGNKLNIYVGRSTQGINGCIQHFNKEALSDVNIYDKWDQVIYFTGANQEWTVDNIYDLERMFIGFFKSDKSKWNSLNIQRGNVGNSDIRDLNTKIAAILSFISQERFGFNLGDINASNTIIDKYLEETAKSAIEIYANKDKVQAYGAYTYIKTKFFRYLVRIMCESGLTNHSEARFKLVPIQDFSKAWTDEELYKKYGFTQEEIDHIESTINALD